MDIHAQPIKETHLAKESQNITPQIEKLTEAIDKLTSIESKIEKQNRLFPTLMRSIAYALGSTIGLAVVLSIIFYILKSIGLFGDLNTALNNLKDLKNIYK